MKYFLFPRRIGRLSWLLRFLVIMAAVAAAIILTSPRLGDRMEPKWWTDESFKCVMFFGLAFYTLWYVHLPRARSMGLHGGVLVLSFLPPINILLFTAFLLAGEDYWKKLRQRRYPSQTRPPVAPPEGAPELDRDAG